MNEPELVPPAGLIEQWVHDATVVATAEDAVSSS
jgi:hypothetical protein